MPNILFETFVIVGSCSPVSFRIKLKIFEKPVSVHSLKRQTVSLRVKNGPVPLCFFLLYIDTAFNFLLFFSPFYLPLDSTFPNLTFLFNYIMSFFCERKSFNISLSFPSTILFYFLIFWYIYVTVLWLWEHLQQSCRMYYVHFFSLV